MGSHIATRRTEPTVLLTRILAWWYRNDLSRLALLFGSDKWGSHWYTQHYQRVFASIKHERLAILEIGVGGHRRADHGGESLRMWKAYFRRSRIVGIDLRDKTHFIEPRIDIRQCDQTDAAGLTRLSKEYGGFDIVIDDGSHRNSHVIRTFEIMFPLLRQAGLYAIEDIQTAYWPTYGGGMDVPYSSIERLKRLIDGLNYAEYPVAQYEPSYFDRHIVGISFFHNLVLIRKGHNNEGTNMPKLVTREQRIVQRQAAGPTNLGTFGGGSNMPLGH